MKKEDFKIEELELQDFEDKQGAQGPYTRFKNICDKCLRELKRNK